MTSGNRYRGVTRDVAGVVGLVLIAYGSWLFNRPVGFIVAGLMLVAIALFGFSRDKDS